MKTRLGWLAFATAAALFPELALPVYSLAVNGYLTVDPTVLIAILLPCAALTFAASVPLARRLWSTGWVYDTIGSLCIISVGTIDTAATAATYWSGGTACYECAFGWFFMFALPALAFLLMTGALWLALLVSALRSRRILVVSSRV